MPLILGANSLAGGGYEVDNSLRFNDGSSDYLNRTFGVLVIQQIWTISSTWFKISELIIILILYFQLVQMEIIDYGYLDIILEIHLNLKLMLKHLLHKQ
jgi:hypothetical protein